MNLGQRFYLREVFSGLGLTAGHFFRNMGRHTRSGAATPAAPSPSSIRTSGAGWRPACAACTGSSAAKTDHRAAWRA